MEELEQVHNFLKDNFQEYISLIAIGSITNDDNWIEGRSDKDILIMFESFPNNHIQKINNFLKTTNFDDVYTFVPMLKNYWIPNRKHSHDFSGRFRSKTIYGIDLIPEKQIPSKEDAFNIYSKGLEDVKNRITRTLVNEGIWSEKKIRNVFWKLFKHTFMHLAIKHYYQTENYPNSRNKIVETINEPVLKETLDFLNDIDNREKKDIVNIGTKLLNYLNSL
jgi:hypothetical protein